MKQATTMVQKYQENSPPTFDMKIAMCEGSDP
jgi:hypothetical protein